jgi:thioredoxin reductase (NADPH)
VQVRHATSLEQRQVTSATPSIMDTRREQMFPTLQPFEIELVRRFGEVRSFKVGEPLAKVGEVGHGISIILAGRVEVTWYDQSGHRVSIVTHGAGEFLGELAQLAGRPALVDACARETVEALIIPPDRLRALFVAEAELGERIMRAFILRRVGLLDMGDLSGRSFGGR